MQHGNFQFLICEVFVHSNAGVRGPAQPERGDENETHPMARVGEVLSQRRRVLLVVDRRPAVQPSLHFEYVEVVVHDRNDAWTEDEDS